MTKQELEFREGNILKLLIRFSVPSTLASLITVIYNITDRYFIGQAVGREGIGALAVLFPLIIVFNACGMFFATGGGVLASIYLGKNEQINARKTLGTSIFIIITMGLLITLACLIFSKEILTFLGASKNNLGPALEYTRYFFPSIIFQILFISMTSFVRTDGFPLVSFGMNITSALTNMILDYIFVMKLNQGMKGAALATSMASFLSFILICIYFSRTKLLKFEFKYFKFNLKIFKEMFSIAISGFINQSINGIFSFILNSQLLRYGGDIALASMGIMSIVRSFVNTSYIGLNQGRLPIISYNWGAKQYNRVISAFNYSFIITAISSIILVFLIRVYSFDIVRFFIKNDPELIKYTGEAIPIHLGFMVSTAIYLSCANYFQAVGKGHITTRFIVLRLLVLTIPLTYILPLKFGVLGVLISFPISDSLTAIVAFIVASREMKRLKSL